MHKHIESETGLHNLLAPAKKAAKLKEFIMREFTEYYQANLCQKLLNDASIKEVTEVFTNICIKYYGSNYRLSHSGVVRNGERRIIIYPMNLVSFILYCGFDMPPTNLPQYGGWEGEEHVYTIAAPVGVEMPVASLNKKLVV